MWTEKGCLSLVFRDLQRQALGLSENYLRLESRQLDSGRGPRSSILTRRLLTLGLEGPDLGTVGAGAGCPNSYRHVINWGPGNAVTIPFIVFIELLSHVQLFLTPCPVACQAPLTLGFSK